jgi:hypothetical protein
VHINYSSTLLDVHVHLVVVAAADVVVVAAVATEEETVMKLMLIIHVLLFNDSRSYALISLRENW